MISDVPVLTTKDIAIRDFISQIQVADRTILHFLDNPGVDEVLAPYLEFQKEVTSFFDEMFEFSKELCFSNEEELEQHISAIVDSEVYSPNRLEILLLSPSLRAMQNGYLGVEIDDNGAKKFHDTGCLVIKELRNGLNHNDVYVRLFTSLQVLILELRREKHNQHSIQHICEELDNALRYI